MKKLIVHIGYPKTATTSIQENVFAGLHNGGLINYLGRTAQRTRSKLGFKSVDYSEMLRTNFQLNGPVEKITKYLSNEKINVISDEDFLFPTICTYARFGGKVSLDQMLFHLKQQLTDDIAVKVLISLRNQPQLLFFSLCAKISFPVQCSWPYQF